MYNTSSRNEAVLTCCMMVTRTHQMKRLLMAKAPGTYECTIYWLLNVFTIKPKFRLSSFISGFNDLHRQSPLHICYGSLFINTFVYSVLWYTFQSMLKLGVVKHFVRLFICRLPGFTGNYSPIIIQLICHFPIFHTFFQKLEMFNVLSTKVPSTFDNTTNWWKGISTTIISRAQPWTSVSATATHLLLN